ncbi:BolA/IbaG family iron-sulfur metabolism protein [Buchnera aphidicola]|uniref:BolA/IbaG family iron-sulfur metabolism protein n=1 Tax=Buchnera aphidicola TaxID=9 RepID=UPI0031B86425
MNKKKIENMLKKEIKLYKIKIKKENKNIEIVAVSNTFLNKTELQRQQTIYKPIQNLIIKKKIHAVIIYTYSIKEWKKKLNKKKHKQKY